MKCLILLALLGIASCMPSMGKNVNIEKDGSINITDFNGKNILISKGGDAFQTKHIEIRIAGNKLPLKVVKVDEINHVRVEGRSSLDRIVELFREYEGNINEETYQRLVHKIQEAVRVGDVSPIVHKILEKLDIDDREATYIQPKQELHGGVPQASTQYWNQGHQGIIPEVPEYYKNHERQDVVPKASNQYWSQGRQDMVPEVSQQYWNQKRQGVVREVLDQYRKQVSQGVVPEVSNQYWNQERQGVVPQVFKQYWNPARQGLAPRFYTQYWNQERQGVVPEVFDQYKKQELQGVMPEVFNPYWNQIRQASHLMGPLSGTYQRKSSQLPTWYDLTVPSKLQHYQQEMESLEKENQVLRQYVTQHSRIPVREQSWDQYIDSARGKESVPRYWNRQPESLVQEYQMLNQDRLEKPFRGENWGVGQLREPLREATRPQESVLYRQQPFESSAKKYKQFPQEQKIQPNEQLSLQNLDVR